MFSNPTPGLRVATRDPICNVKEIFTTLFPSTMPSVAWQVTASAKREELFAQVPPDWKLDDYVVQSTQSPWETIASALSTGELDITELPAHELLRALQTNELTASEVAFAFCHRAVLAHQMVRVTLSDLR